MVLQGYVRHYTGDLHCAQILDPNTLASGDPATIAAACLLTVDPGFAERTRDGDMLVVAGALHGAEAAEAAVVGLHAVGIVAVVCAAAEPALLALAAQVGLAILVVPAAAHSLNEGDVLQVDLARGSLEAHGTRWSTEPLPAEALAAVRRVSLFRQMRRVVEAEGFAE